MNTRETEDESRSASSVWVRRFGFRAWGWQPVTPTLTDKPAELTRAGWQRIETEQMVLMDCLFGQLADVRQRAAAPDTEYWVRSDELAFAAQNPGALGFLVPERVQKFLNHDVPWSVNPYPPPRFGEVGIVLTDLEYREWFISDLDKEAQALQRRLNEALLILQGSEADDLFWLMASLPYVGEAYQILLHKEQAAARVTWSERVADLLAGMRSLDPLRLQTIQSIEQELHNLEAAQQQIKHLFQPTEQDRQRQQELYQQLWPEIRLLARKLAMAYCRQAQPAKLYSLPSQSSVRQSYTPEQWLKQGKKWAPVFADPISMALTELLRSEEAFTRLRAIKTVGTPVGTADLEVRLEPDLALEETEEDALTWRKHLSDHLVDTWLAIQMLSLACTPDELILPEGLGIRYLLETCLRRKSNYAYTPAQRQLVLRDLEVLKRLHVRILPHLPNHRSAPPIESPLLDVHLRENESLVGDLGEWIYQLPQQWRSTIPLSRQLLRLHAEDDVRTKRLGLYLSFRFARQSLCKLDGQALAERTGLPLGGKNPKRTRDAWMRAFKVLAGLPVLSQEQRRQGLDEPFVWDSRQETPDLGRQILAFWAENRDEGIEALQRGFLERRWPVLSWYFQATEPLPEDL